MGKKEVKQKTFLDVASEKYTAVKKILDYSEVNQKRNEVYNAIGEYIICLENSLEREQDYYERAEIKKEIQQLKMEQEKYFVPAMLNQNNVAEKNIKIKKRNK